MDGSNGDHSGLHEQLLMCQRELAQVREEQESWAEDLSRERRKRVTAEKRLTALSIAVDQKLRELDAASPKRSLRRTRHADDTSELLTLINSSNLFRGPWYLRHYPEVVGSGMSPARHYLLVGAELGLDPGPKFRTQRYLDAHPDAAARGVNPLVHYLQSRGDDDGPFPGYQDRQA